MKIKGINIGVVLDCILSAQSINYKEIYASAARNLYYAYTQSKKDDEGNIIIHRDPKKAYYYNRLSGALGGEEDSAHRMTRKLVFNELGPILDEEGRFIYETIISEEEQAEMDKQVAEFVKDIKPNMFLDETSMRLF